MRTFSFVASSTLLFVLPALLGCSTEPRELIAATSAAPVCQPKGERLSALVLWSTSWDEGGGYTPARTAAKQGIELAFRGSGCFGFANIMPAQPEFDRPLGQVSESAARAFAHSVMTPCDRILGIVITQEKTPFRLSELGAYILGRPRVLVAVRALRLSPQPATESWELRGTYVFHGTENLTTTIKTAVTLAAIANPQ
jgi:hypothetical protein